MNFAKFLITPFLAEHLQWLLPPISCDVNKKILCSTSIFLALDILKKYSFFKVFHIVLPSLKSWKEQAEQTEMVWVWEPLTKARERYWMMELRTMYPYAINNRYGDEYKTENTYINMAKKFPLLPRKHNRIGLHKGFCKLSPQEFNGKFNTMLDINIRDMPNFLL